MADRVRVKPVRAGMALRHPSEPDVLPDEGGLWPNDQHTARRIHKDGVIEVVEETAPVVADPAPPAVAEGAERKVQPVRFDAPAPRVEPASAKPEVK